MRDKKSKNVIFIAIAAFVVALLFFLLHDKLEFGGEEIVRNENAPEIKKDEISNYLMTEKFPDNFLPKAQELENIPQEVKEFFEDYYETSSIANEDVSLYVFDLNDDGTDEYLAMLWRLDGEMFRGAAGNGPIPVLSSEERGIELLGTLAGNGFTMTKEKTNGYHNILVNYHMGAMSGSETMYKFRENSDGKMEYQESFKQMYELEEKKPETEAVECPAGSEMQWGRAFPGDAEQFTQVTCAKTKDGGLGWTDKVTIKGYDNNVLELPADSKMEVSEPFVKKADIDNDGVEEFLQLVDDGTNHCCAAARIIKDNKVIFTAKPKYPVYDIIPAANEEGFYVEWHIEQQYENGMCCPSGHMRTHFIKQDGKFVPVKELEVEYFSLP